MAKEFTEKELQRLRKLAESKSDVTKIDLDIDRARQTLESADVANQADCAFVVARLARPSYGDCQSEMRPLASALQSLLSGDERDSRRAAAWALKYITDEIPAAGKQAIPDLFVLLTEPTATTRRAAILTLQNLVNEYKDDVFLDSNTQMRILQRGVEHDIYDNTIQPHIESTLEWAPGVVVDKRPDAIPTAPEIDLTYDHFEFGEQIGHGGIAVVHRAELPSADEPIAVKRLLGTDSGETVDSEPVSRLLEEARTWSTLDDHDHVVDVIGWGSSPVPWIALEYMDGGDLQQRIGHTSLDESVWYAEAIVTAILNAHDHGILHLDIKPQNILFRTTQSGVWDVPKVADWGVSKHVTNISGNTDKITPQYAAPEQLAPDMYDGLDRQTDIYQLGITLYELFTGRPPFVDNESDAVQTKRKARPQPPSEVDSRLTTAFDSVLLRALAPEPSDRYERMSYLRDDITELQE